jgi:hypothetical protein
MAYPGCPGARHAGKGAILRALSGRESWLQMADILGLSPRTVRRLRYEQYGYDGPFDQVLGCASRLGATI